MSEQKKVTSSTVITVSNHRPSPYSAFIEPTKNSYVWYPASNAMSTSYDLTFAEVQYLHNASSTFKDGYLSIENEEVRKMLGLETEEFKTFNITVEEIAAALKGNMNKFNTLKKYAGNRDKMAQIIGVAKEVGLENATKISALAEWSGYPRDKLMDDLAN
ncbi:hypothetical protein [Bacillus sp. Marseille-P3800]|uniref:hypothetical protein n=1 Tax=Bacillus sp. Marseille-P3800 TaxID=2014782 RepID=UPI000C07B951|nr:hypothetical protein [Bacillus sp. Marseille-P3800]